MAKTTVPTTAPVSEYDQFIESIAIKHFDVETLATRNSDSLDFKNVSVWQIKAALDEAFARGSESGKAELAEMF